MEHPNAHAAHQARGYTTLPGRARTAAMKARTALVITGCATAAVAAVAATPLGSRILGGTEGLPPVAPTAAQVTTLGPHVAVYALPAKKGNGEGEGDGSEHSTDSGKSPENSGSSGSSGSAGTGGSDDDSTSSDQGGGRAAGPHGHKGSSSGSGESDSSESSSSSSGSGDVSGSNTVDGTERGGARTYNHHSVSPSSSPASGSAPSNQAQPGEPTGSAGDSGSGSTSSGAAPALMLMRVACPSSVSAETVCGQVASADGAAASLPAKTNAASLPAASSLPTGSTPSSLGTNSTTGSAGEAGRADLSALESRSGKKIELTGYSFQDNQGGDNAKISCPQIHQQAGGTGTYQDPITVASGGKSGGASADGIKCGDRFYIPSVRRYVIVEDTGNTPNSAMAHLDMYVGDDPNKSCMNKISGTVTAISHPPPGLPVLSGPIGSHGGCALPGSTSPTGGGQ